MLTFDVDCTSPPLLPPQETHACSRPTDREKIEAVVIFAIDVQPSRDLIIIVSFTTHPPIYQSRSRGLSVHACVELGLGSHFASLKPLDYDRHRILR